MDAKKVVVVGVALLLLFFVISQPNTSADLVHQLLAMLRSAAESLITFMSALFSG